MWFVIGFICGIGTVIALLVVRILCRLAREMEDY